VTRADEPVLITTAPPSPAAERRARERRYLITMGLRLVCFILAIVLFGLGLRWIAAFAVAGSLILPWVAVIAANAGPPRSAGSTPSLYAARKAAELESSTPPPPDPFR
jgi:apolipoprotein N-acyltransferase